MSDRGAAAEANTIKCNLGAAEVGAIGEQQLKQVTLLVGHYV